MVGKERPPDAGKSAAGGRERYVESSVAGGISDGGDAVR